MAAPPVARLGHDGPLVDAAEAQPLVDAHMNALGLSPVPVRFGIWAEAARIAGMEALAAAVDQGRPAEAMVEDAARRPARRRSSSTGCPGESPYKPLMDDLVGRSVAELDPALAFHLLDGRTLAMEGAPVYLSGAVVIGPETEFWVELEAAPVEGAEAGG